MPRAGGDHRRDRSSPSGLTADAIEVREPDVVERGADLHRVVRAWAAGRSPSRRWRRRGCRSSRSSSSSNSRSSSRRGGRRGSSRGSGSRRRRRSRGGRRTRCPAPTFGVRRSARRPPSATLRGWPARAIRACAGTRSSNSAAIARRGRRRRRRARTRQATHGVSGSAVEDLGDDRVGRHALGLALEVEDHAVAQRRQRDAAGRRRSTARSGRRAARGSWRPGSSPARRAASCRSARTASTSASPTGVLGVRRLHARAPRSPGPGARRGTWRTSSRISRSALVDHQHCGARRRRRCRSCGRGSRAARRVAGSSTRSLKKKRSSCASGSG